MKIHLLKYLIFSFYIMLTSNCFSQENTLEAKLNTAILFNLEQENWMALREIMMDANEMTACSNDFIKTIISVVKHSLNYQNSAQVEHVRGQAMNVIIKNGNAANSTVEFLAWFSMNSYSHNAGRAKLKLQNLLLTQRQEMAQVINNMRIQNKADLNQVVSYIEGIENRTK